MSDAHDQGPSPLRKRPVGLGRGLSALLGDIERDEPGAGGPAAATGVRMMDVRAITAHPGQPRRQFDEKALDELAASLIARGMLQPIVVRRNNNMWQIVAGERRWRAAQRAQLSEVPVIIKELDDGATLEIALIENIQREQLNAVEEGETYRRLIREFGYSQEALGQLVHKSRSHIANLMRLLDLPDAVRVHLANGTISMGHARALVLAPDAERLAEDVIARDLSVRDTERLVRGAKPKRSQSRSSPRAAVDPDILALEKQLGDLLGLKVRISHDQRAGAVSLHYASLEQLDMICQRLSGDTI